MGIFDSINAIQMRMQEINARFGAFNGITAPPVSSYQPQASGVSFSQILNTIQEQNTANYYGPITGSEQEYTQYINEAAEKWNLDPALLKAVIKQESGFNPTAISSVGAMGLMQLMPETARSLNVSNPMNPRENIMGGARYLRGLLDRFNGDLTRALAAYNAGPGTVEQYGGVPPFQETQSYVANILAMYNEFRKKV